MSARTPADDADDTTDTISRTVDWVAGVLLALGGLLFGALGVLLNAAADRTTLARMVAEGSLQSDVLTDAELVDVSYAVLWWLGLGLAVTGALLALAGVVFLVVRRRTRGTEGRGAASHTLDAVVGAVVTVVVAFVPFSPVVGGGVAGYLSHDHGISVGALSGLLATLPVAFVFAFLAAGFVSAGFAVLAVVLLFGLVVAAVYMVGLSAVGGFVGQYLHREHFG